MCILEINFQSIANRTFNKSSRSLEMKNRG